jgi:hypothetical protein
MMHKIDLTAIADMLETGAFSGQMLDAGYSMLDNLHAINGGIHKHPVSRNQYPGSVNDSKVFRRDSIDLVSYLILL